MQKCSAESKQRPKKTCFQARKGNIKNKVNKNRNNYAELSKSIWFPTVGN